MSSKTLTQRPEWQALTTHAAKLEDTRISTLFEKDIKRFAQFHLQHDGLLLDYSKQRATPETLELLMGLAHASDLEGWRDKMFAGKKINSTENRAVLHTALRAANPSPEVKENLARMKSLGDKIRAGKITDVINIGIGGSSLGPQMACEALKSFADGPRVHFVSNVDGSHIYNTVRNLNNKSTLIIVASKTFATQETMVNARSALAWAGNAGNFIAVTSNAKAAREFGIAEENIFPLWDWVGGRYSLWSAIGFPICLSAGFENFERLLAGARSMDKHFRTQPLEQNIPVLLGMLGIWQRNFCRTQALAVLPYAQDLEYFPAWLQQLDMESNGKNTDRDGKPVDYATGPVVFGEPGTNGQHAFYQLLHQGTEIIPCEFIIPAEIPNSPPEHQQKLLANALGQSEALMLGQHSPDPHKSFPGNRPSTTIMIKKLDPYHLGMLLALYEHKIFVQGIIWNLNSFDQWGVELGKTLAQKILSVLESSKSPSFDSSTNGLLSAIRWQKNL